MAAAPVSNSRVMRWLPAMSAAGNARSLHRVLLMIVAQLMCGVMLDEGLRKLNAYK